MSLLMLNSSLMFKIKYLLVLMRLSPRFWIAWVTAVSDAVLMG
jgi:hypothetical protein